MVIKGIVEEIIYRNDDNNYTVININVNSENITAVGKFPQICEGECLELSGDFSKHSKYGEQFCVKTIKVTPPNTLDGIVRYLSSGLIKGVGPVTALNIVSKFGKDSLDIIEFSPHKLAEVRGISLKKAEDIAESFNEIKKMQNAVIFLQQYNISTNMAIKIFNFYKDKCEMVLKTNPYKLVEDVDGIGFYTADKIAQNMGVAKDSDFRFRASILHCIKEYTEKNGNTLIFLPNLIEIVSALLKLEDDYSDKIKTILNNLETDQFIKIFELDNNTAIMLTRYYNIEKLVANYLKLIDLSVKNSELDISDEIANYEAINHITMHELQKDAVNLAVNNGVTIITGGPGTGKTTIVKCILQIFKNMGKKVLLCAPTGRAAKRLSESTNSDAQTIHRALEVSFNDMNMFFYNHLNKLPYDIIIVDEFSMVDIQLAYFLIRSIRKGARLILVGDKDQLASVGAGNVLADILNSKKFSTLMLTQIYRQAEDSMIIKNAHLINNGNMPEINNKSKDFFYLDKSDTQDMLSTVVQMCKTRIPNYLNIDSKNVQVLAPMKAGVCGVDNINKNLQAILNPPSINKLEIVTEKNIYRVNDRIMQISNNYEREWKKGTESGTGVFNGDIGTICDINIGTGELIIEFEDGRVANYLKSDLSELILSYAITIHKSQGSEFDAVIIPVTGGPPTLLTKNLIYTAVTRAKKMLVLIGNKNTIRGIIKNTYTVTRYTMLKNFLLNDDELNNFVLE